ncbi:hypothetical protein SDC9_131241 [bioreactor metagenome]|uniref:Uncharacterized protein n=1 Tax=bioreactor metagenome TaxID=1076179 RepID=A0A645D3W3_9ZZZZ
MAQRRADHILGNLHMLLRIDRARHGQAGRQVGHGQQLVHARAGRAQQLQARIGRQHARLEAPGEHGLDRIGRCFVAMGPDLYVGRQRSQRIDDGCAHARVDVDQDSHVSISPCNLDRDGPGGAAGRARRGLRPYPW